MDAMGQDLVVVAAVLGALVFVSLRWVRFWRRALRGTACGSGGCGSGCGDTAKRSRGEATAARRVPVALEPTRRRRAG